MSDLRLTSDSTSSSRLFLGRFVSQSPFQMLKIKRLLISITCLNFLTTMCRDSQNYSQARVACAEGSANKRGPAHAIRACRGDWPTFALWH